MRLISCGAVALVSAALLSRTSMAADVPLFDGFEQTYLKEIRPIFARVCDDCHSEKVMEAEIDLTVFKSLADIRKHPQTWQKVAEMLDSDQMPPKDQRQPSDAEKALLQRWVH